MVSLIQHFEADFLTESQPQNPEYRINPANFHPYNALHNSLHARLLSSADISYLYKQFGSRSGPTVWSGFILFASNDKV